MGEGGFEPPAPWSQTKNHTKLDHPPLDKRAVVQKDFVKSLI